MATEFVILVTCLIWLLGIGSDYETVLAGIFVVALIFPVAFYHHSWSLWLGLDYLIEGLPKYEEPLPGLLGSQWPGSGGKPPS